MRVPVTKDVIIAGSLNRWEATDSESVLDRELAPEKRLMAAILKDAIKCREVYRLSAREQEKRLFREATRWLLAEDANRLYSFECICRALEIDPSAVRRYLRLTFSATLKV